MTLSSGILVRIGTIGQHRRMTLAAKWLEYWGTRSTAMLVLWSYLIWYLVVLVRYFDPNPRIWLTSIGLSFIIGIALLVNTTASGKQRVTLERWPILRLFITPFCVSSFSALVKGQGFFLIFSPRSGEMVVAGGICACVWGMAWLARGKMRRGESPSH
jgi:hypothetical protein